MKLFIPEIGTAFKLEKDWEFDLYVESRNEALYLAAGFSDEWNWYENRQKGIPAQHGWTRDGEYKQYHKKVIIPANSLLTVDRLYIRRGQDDYSSLSFNLNRKSVNPESSFFAKNINSGKGRCRFWAKVADVNNITFSLVENS